jgi:uncharacterized membrane protein YeiH
MTTELLERATRTRRPQLRLLAAQLPAILLFAVEGGSLGAGAGLGAVGVLVAAFLSPLGGGLIRDLIIGARPPAALRGFAVPATALLGGALAMACHGIDTGALAAVPLEVRAPLNAAALGLFCACGTLVAVEHRMRPLAAVLLGTLSAVGGGIIRDVLCGTVPAALRSDFCVVAAATGAAVTVAGLRCGLPRAGAAALGGAACATVSLVAALRGWVLPPVG